MQELSGIEYVMCDIACKHDKTFEKKNWNGRINHFSSLDLEDESIYRKASNPIGLRSAINAYKAFINGEPSGYMFSLDACSSGLQLLSLLVSCEKSWSLCGGNSTKCVDSYTEIFESMDFRGNLTRKSVKAAIMTSLYGSKSGPKKAFGDKVEHFYETMETMVPGAWQLNLALQELWNDVKNGIYSWVLPDNFHAHIETKVKVFQKFKFLDQTLEVPKFVTGKPEFHKGLAPNLIHSIDGMIVREMFRRCMFNPIILQYVDFIFTETVNNDSITPDDKMVISLWSHYKNTGFLSTRILEHITPDNAGHLNKKVIYDMIDTFPIKPFELVSVHDCFRCHPNNGNDLRKQYNIIMADINDSSLLDSLVSQIIKQPVTVMKTGKIKRENILKSNYALA